MATEPAYAQPLRILLEAPTHGSMTDSVTDALREGILSGVLVPMTWLREDEIAQALEVSRTPVREALRRLSDEGLTQRVANRGTVVAPMTMDEIFAVYAVRETLEGLAARHAATRRQPWLIDELTRVHRQMSETDPADTAAFATLNLEFHRLLRQASGNSYLERFLRQVEHAVRRFGQTTYSAPGRVQETLDEHFAIVQAIVAGDADEAERCAIHHMRKAREIRLQQFLADQVPS
ncbi:GntR family transcriptional regulator [soil metagenome]